MNSKDFSFSISSSPSGNGREQPATRYLAPPYNARLFDNQTVSLLVSGDSRAHSLSLPQVQILSQCGQMRTLDEHADQAVRALKAPRASTAEIRRTLEQLLEQGLLLSEDDVLQRLREQRPRSQPSAIETLFIRSCDRPDTLRRLLESLAARELPPQLEHCVVLDDSKDPAQREQTRQLVEEFAARLEGRLALIDTERRRQLLTSIAGAADVDIDSLFWTVEGGDDDTAPSYGANLNLALLLGAGSQIALMDDDASFDAFTLPGHNGQPAFRRLQTGSTHFPEPDWNLPGDHYEALQTHPLDAHAKLLGASAGDLAELADHSEHDRRSLLEDLDPQLLHDLSGPTRVRVTSSGTLGDPGTSSLHWLLAEEPAQLRPLLENAERCRALLCQRRVARCAQRPQATLAYALMTTTLTGIDNRELLLPTQARGTNEDMLFGALVGYMHPGSLQVGLPHMLFHQHPEPRRWQPDDFERPRSIERGGFLARQVEALARSAHSSTPERRLALLAASLRDLADSDDLGWRLKHDLMERRADLIEQINVTRQALKPPSWLDQDFQRALEPQRSITPESDERIAELSATLPAFLNRYADILQHWHKAWQFCHSVNLSELLSETE